MQLYLQYSKFTRENVNLGKYHKKCNFGSVKRGHFYYRTGAYNVVAFCNRFSLDYFLSESLFDEH